MRTSRGGRAWPTRVAGLAGLTILALTACGSPSTPGSPVETPPVALPTVATPAPTPDSADTTVSPTPNGTASPGGTPTAQATATPQGTATPNGTATPGLRTLELPQRVESFNRVEQRSENDVRIGSYYSDTLQTVIEIRLMSGRPARDAVTTLGGTDPTNVGEALCSSQGDTICAREQNGVTVAVVAKELPATMVSDLTGKVLAAR